MSKGRKAGARSIKGGSLRKGSGWRSVKGMSKRGLSR